MSSPINARRRRFLGAAAVSVGAMEMVKSGLAHAQSVQAGAPAAGANAATSNASIAEINRIARHFFFFDVLVTRNHDAQKAPPLQLPDFLNGAMSLLLAPKVGLSRT